MMTRQEPLITIKKKVLPSFIKVKFLLFSIQYGHANFPCVLHPKNISYTGKSFIVPSKLSLFENFVSLQHHTSKP